MVAAVAQVLITMVLGKRVLVQVVLVVVPWVEQIHLMVEIEMVHQTPAVVALVEEDGLTSAVLVVQVL
jgi:hypothetical protein